MKNLVSALGDVEKKLGDLFNYGLKQNITVFSVLNSVKDNYVKRNSDNSDQWSIIAQNTILYLISGGERPSTMGGLVGGRRRTEQPNMAVNGRGLR